MKRKYIGLVLCALTLCGCNSSRKMLLATQAGRHYYIIQGYRPMALLPSRKVVDNPFPLSAYEKETLLDSVKQVCQTYLGKYSNHNLDTWPMEDCEAYLRAKAAQIVLQFQPDYYRAYAVPEIRRFRSKYGVPYYRLCYYYDPSKEETGCSILTPGLISVMVNIWNAQAASFDMPVLNDMGYRFCAPDYEYGLLKDWVPYPYMIWNYKY